MRNSTDLLKENQMETVVTRKGQITIPAALRHELGLKRGDRMTFYKENGDIKIIHKKYDIENSYQAIPALKKSLSLSQMRDVIQAERAAVYKKKQQYLKK